MVVGASDDRTKIALGFVTYGPAKPLVSRLRMADRERFRFYVFDNSPQHDVVRAACKSLPRCFYLTCGKNLGLGYGLSSVCAQAYYDGYSCLLFFDQDTVFTSDTLSFIDHWYAQNAHVGNTHSAVAFNARGFQDKSDQRLVGIKDVSLAISSGSLFFLENVKTLNWHNEKYFVDCVDYEFCLRSTNNDLKIGEYSWTPGFDHESEQPDVKQKLFGREALVRKYSSNRISGTTSASLRLFFQAIRSGNGSFALRIARSLTIYLTLQIVARTKHRTSAAHSNG